MVRHRVRVRHIMVRHVMVRHRVRSGMEAQGQARDVFVLCKSFFVLCGIVVQNSSHNDN